MRKKLWFFLLLTLSMGCKTAYYVKPQIANEVSLYNRAYKDGRKVGWESGREEGYQEGHRNGYTQGLFIGKKMGADSLLRATKELNTDEYHLMMMIQYDLLKDRIECAEHARNDGYLIGLEESNMNAFELGFKEGYQKAFDYLFTINLGRGEDVSYPERGDSRLAIDYEKVAKLLHGIGEEYLYVDFERFSGALHEIHLEILAYLVQRLKFNLSPQEEAEVFQRYEEIHNRLARSYYRRYFSLCRTRNRNYENKSFYDYRYYNSADIFLDIVGLGISAVVDVVFTYAKSNSQFATTSGFEVMGHVAELIIDEVVLPIEDLLLKQALVLDYDQQIPQLVLFSKQLLEPFIAETRVHRKKVREHITVNKFYSATVEMEIETIVNVGFNLADFSIELDHYRQSFLLNLSAQPRLLQVVKQDYKVRCIKSEVYVPWPGGYGRENLPEKVLEEIFEAHRDSPESLDICRKPLQKATLEIIIPSLVKIMEPCISLPVGCYEAQVRFGNYSSQKIITARCR